MPRARDEQHLGGSRHARRGELERVEQHPGARGGRPHRFWVSASQLAGTEVRFTPTQAHQMRNVLRLRPGAQVHVFDGLTLHDHVVELVDVNTGRIVGQAAQAPEPRTRVVAYPALLQRDKFETVLQKLTEVGVAAIAPVMTARSLVRTAPDAGRLERWTAIVREAAEQCGRGRIPTLLPTSDMADALHRAEGTRLVAYEQERHHTLGEALAQRPECVALFVGPEGGFTSDEVDCARRAGAQAVTLGPRVLRAETASPLLAALVLYQLGDLSWPA
jgi:16S rRNA (uracil1498-N3)-methyltransferase